MDSVVNALISEINSRKNYLNACKVNSIYIGGGTPSLLSISQLCSLFDAVYDAFEFEQTAEVTIELNPDDLTYSYLDGLKFTPVNRLSIGIQSFFESDLKYLGRNHNAAQGIHALQMLKEKGFVNISVDLIYGIPDLNMDNWYKNLTIIDSFDLQHISAYALTVEERTLLEYNLRKKKKLQASDSFYIDQYQILKEYTYQKGYLHYEISNFAKAGFISRHNTSYWTGDHYIGIGPSAHSYNGLSRQWNFCRIKDYIKAMNTYEVFYEKEELSKKQKFNEYILTRLRTMWGCNSDLIKQEFGKILADHFLKAVKNYVDTGLIKKYGDTYILSDEGELLADAITTELFIEQ